MNEYVEWMQKCVNGAFHPEISIQSFNGYESALLWQILFFLTIILTSYSSNNNLWTICWTNNMD